MLIQLNINPEDNYKCYNNVVLSFSLENFSDKSFDSAQPDRQSECHTERSRSVF
jgi:hypothetical protein